MKHYKTKICEICKKEYETCLAHQRFCSKECFRKIHPLPKQYEKECIKCGKKFTTFKNLSKFCSKECNYLFQKSQRPSCKRWTELTEFCLERDGYKCKGCNSDKNLVIHHIIFLSHRGTNNPDNLITLCRKCHGQKHNLN